MKKEFIASPKELITFMLQYKIASFYNPNSEDYFGTINAYTEKFDILNTNSLSYLVYNSEGDDILNSLYNISLCGNKFKYIYEDFGFETKGILSSDKLNKVCMILYK